jgi:hypothetical protein
MADRLWGNHISNEDMPFAILHGQGGGGVVPNASGLYFSVGSFYMPWAGNLSLTLTAVGSWAQSGHQQWSVHLANSTPAPPSCSFFHQICINQYASMVGQLPAYAMWTNLAKGQVVTFTLYVGAGGGGHNVNFEGWSATVKAWPG